MAGPVIPDANSIGVVQLRVPERGYCDVDVATWARLAPSKDFRRLHEQGVVDVVYRPFGAVRLKGTCYVGRALLGNVVLDFTEKVEGAVEALLSYATHGSFVPLKAKGPVAATGNLLALLVSQFLEAVRRYSSRGRQFEYRRRQMLGALAGGRLLVTPTIRARGRGLGHLLAFETNATTYATEVNRIVYRALAEVERLARVIQLDDGDLARARSFSLLYSDCRDSETLFRQRSYFSSRAALLEAGNGDELVADLMALASLVLSHESFDSSLQAMRAMPRTWVLNLENLFENAVRRVLQSVVTGATVLKGAPFRRFIFDRESRFFKANPDLVMSLSGSRCVGDVKYKNVEGKPAAGDVYQLLAHAEAFDATRAFLVFPGERFTVQTVGSTRRGTAVHIFSVRVSHLEEDLRGAANALGLATALGSESSEDSSSELEQTLAVGASE